MPIRRGGIPIPSRAAGRRGLRAGLKAGLLVLGGAVAPAAADECARCHGADRPAGADPKAKIVAVIPGTAHSDVACADCHQDAARCPDPKPAVRVNCSECHEDAIKALSASSHHSKLSQALARKGAATPTAACLACHGADVHGTRAVKDPESPTHHTRVSDTCLTCHREVQPINVERFADSVHGVGLREEGSEGRKGGETKERKEGAKAGGEREGKERKEGKAGAGTGARKAAACVDCHGGHGIDHSSLPASKVFRTRIAETCGACHPEARDAYGMSVHARAVADGFHEAPVCTDCHGEHGIRPRSDPASSVAAGNVSRTCSACHASEAIATKFGLPRDRVSTFHASYHGLSGRLGDVRAANCASCHGNHAILPSSEPASAIHRTNLARTCGACHPGAETRFITERIHTAPAAPSHWTVGAVRTLYLALIVAVIGGMLAHNGLDLLCKFLRGTPAERAAPDGPLFSVHERVQHGLLAAGFIVLAVSGFAIAFPESPFAWPFRWTDGGAEFRRRVHRLSGFALLGLGGWHGFYLLLAARGRAQFRRMMWRLQDLRDAGGVLIRLVRPFTAPVRLPVFSYVEKAEYWALIWGSAVMGVTGLLLVWHDALLAAFPVWVTDLATTVHFWEAVLACLAIFVWHGYAVVFDPDVYPMNVAWWSGKRRNSAVKSE